ncbi:hypothetical protein ACWXVT_02195 [Mycoplasma sp. 1573]
MKRKIEKKKKSNKLKWSIKGAKTWIFHLSPIVLLLSPISLISCISLPQDIETRKWEYEKQKYVVLDNEDNYTKTQLNLKDFLKDSNLNNSQMDTTIFTDTTTTIENQEVPFLEDISLAIKLLDIRKIKNLNLKKMNC